jgi:predicted nucleic acid-binding protein
VIVLDASVVVELVLGTSTGRALGERLAEPTLELHAPHLVDVEVTQVVRRYALAGAVARARAELALDHLEELDMVRHEHGPLISRAWALRHNLTAYDAMYVALAEALDAPLLTGDRRLASASGHAARVEVV